jgi:hypothetical protein
VNSTVLIHVSSSIHKKYHVATNGTPFKYVSDHGTAIHVLLTLPRSELLYCEEKWGPKLSHSGRTKKIDYFLSIVQVLVGVIHGHHSVRLMEFEGFTLAY